MTPRGDQRGTLPWGWWLRATGSQFEDEEGRRWRSVRDAFWQGRLNMPPVHYAAEQQELMLRALESVDAGMLSSSAIVDLFAGDAMMCRQYMCWLHSIGMLDQPEPRVTFSTPSPLEAGLSEEERSAMLMLEATRAPEWEPLPMRDVVEAVALSGAGLAGEAREEALRTFERALGRRRWTFARERVHHTHLVTLTGVAAHARMPTMAVMWSQSFAEARARDNLFAWLATHVHRWDDWGERAYRKGADDFTRHLLSLIVAERGLAS